MSKLVWVGKFYSDIHFTENLFKLAITIYAPSSPQIKVISYLNKNSNETVSISNPDYCRFVCDQIRKLLIEDDYIFMFYNDYLASQILLFYPNLKDVFVYTNAKQHSWLISKTYTRLLLNNVVEMPPFAFKIKPECTFSNLKTNFPTADKFVIQDNNSSGGHGTFILDAYNQDTIDNILENTKGYMVSPFISNSKSCNMHILISNNEILLFPWSIQNISFKNHEVEYNGCQFSSSNILSDLLYDFAIQIGRKLYQINYKGICGIDFFLCENRPIFIELNCRFQASTLVLEHYLNKYLNRSLIELHIQCHGDLLDLTQKDLSGFEINSNYYISKKSELKQKFNNTFIESSMVKCFN